MTKTPCEGFADRIVDYVDGELSQAEAQAIAGHLGECESCRQMAKALQRSLGLARVIWQDNLAIRSDAARRSLSSHTHGTDPGRCPRGHTTNAPRRRSFYVLAAAAVILLAAGSSFLVFFHRTPPQPQPITLEEVQRQVARVGRAAELLAATRLVAQCEGMESIVQQQYRYILREYADTPAAESIKASHDLKLGGMPDD
jgi:anti-sigma factor RsiW